MGNLHGERGSPQSLRWAALKTSVYLAVAFLVLYGGTNLLASLRSDVGTWYYEWELSLPFVPLLIVPYMSIDLFFVAAPFFCRDLREMTTLRRRMMFALIVAGVCFLLFPYRLKFEKPAVDGWTGAMFDAFLHLDQPFNLVPSLHIALLVILADHYGKHLRGAWRWGMFVWFNLIGVSTVLTYQHQIVDVIGGLILGVICFYLVRDPGVGAETDKFGNLSPRGNVNPRIAIYYGVAAVLLLGLAMATWPWGGILLWPVAALVVAVLGYLWFGADIYHKVDGRLTRSTRLLMAPVLWGQHLSLIHYRRQCRPWDEVVPGLLIGRKLTDAEALECECVAVLDLTSEFTEVAIFRERSYRNIPILDLTAPTAEQIQEAVDFIAAELPRGKVLVHCKVGYSRTAAVVGAYLMTNGHAATADDAVRMMRAARPTIVVRPEVKKALAKVAGTLRVP